MVPTGKRGLLMTETSPPVVQFSRRCEVEEAIGEKSIARLNQGLAVQEGNIMMVFSVGKSPAYEKVPFCYDFSLVSTTYFSTVRGHLHPCYE